MLELSLRYFKFHTVDFDFSWIFLDSILLA